MQEYYTFQKVRDRKTGKIGVISSTCYGSFTDKEGKHHSIEYYIRFDGTEYNEVMYYGDEIDKQVEFIKNDFTNVIPNIIELLKNERFERIPEMVQKRLDPNYFSEGSIVFFLEDNWIDRSYDYKYGKSFSLQYGPKYPYIIVENVEIENKLSLWNYEDHDFKFELTLIPYSFSLREKYSNNDGTLRLEEIKRDIDNFSRVVIPFSLTKYFYGDAYSILSRYDKGY